MNNNCAKYLFYCLLFLATNSKIFAQTISIPDSSFEDVDISTHQFFTWHICQYYPSPWIMGSNFGDAFTPTTQSPTNGTYCINVGGGGVSQGLYSFNKILGDQLNGTLQQWKKYYFYLDAACVVRFRFSTNGDIGMLKILLGKHLCGYNQEAWLSPPLDSVWHRYKVEFVPNDDYQYIAIEGWSVTPDKYGVEWVDNLSSIYEEVEQPNLPSGNNAFYNANNKHLEVWCNAANESNTTLVLYNLLGQIIVQQPYVANSSIVNEIDMSALPQSIYIIEQKDQNGKKLWQQKVMK